MMIIDTRTVTPEILSDAIKQALAGEEVFLKEEEQLVKMVSVRKKGQELSDRPLRQGGFARGKIRLDDDWDSKEVNDEIAREFGMFD